MKEQNLNKNCNNCLYEMLLYLIPNEKEGNACMLWLRRKRYMLSCKDIFIITYILMLLEVVRIKCESNEMSWLTLKDWLLKVVTVDRSATHRKDLIFKVNNYAVLLKIDGVFCLWKIINNLRADLWSKLTVTKLENRNEIWNNWSIKEFNNYKLEDRNEI